MNQLPIFTCIEG